MDERLFWIGLGALGALDVAYFFLWGVPYDELNSKYNELNQDYAQLNNNYINLQQNYTQLKTECSEALKQYEACLGRENFFTWVDRFLTLRTLAGLLGLV